ncbi:fused response regulator/thioredoxin-disulfide reductase [Nocardioides gansuensis]|uniref:Fused response regulator/thioredoxin-disulfide reductase n=1 Tax=Nocardioides gansuensis TaxID=2138300 RepID=A0A2T8F5S3_9ACTN|nr:FAD-dependent oxidoreductase [Nocardioides gansuensis]PVG81049.1 fused response regulator/thioredoxin-disulfide reductase [Nocardioides gansuensis]
MSKPVILSVDDDHEVLGAIERDLRRHYRGEYRILKASSGRAGLQAAVELKQRGTPVALFLVDERMPGMSGTEMLQEARKLHPDARRVLLTAYADTEAAIRGINDVGLDHYLLKPWDPPDLRLYPVLDDLLSDWSANVRLPYDGLRVAGGTWSPQSYAVKEFLSRNGVPYRWLDVDGDESVRELVTSVTGDPTLLPVVLFADGSTLVRPTHQELAEKVGMRTVASRPFYDLVIVGGGPAGLAAAVYAASEGLATLMVEQEAPGGQAGTSSQIENYLGFPAGVSGADLARRATAQAKRFGAELLSAQEVTAIRRDDPYRVVRLGNGTEVSSYAVILAQGVSVRTLQVPGVETLTGRGVFYGAAMTEAATYRGRHVCVMGGANSAGQGALFFSRYASRVTMLVRADSLHKSMSRYLIDRIEAASNIEVQTGLEVVEVYGAGHLEGVSVRDVSTGDVRSIQLAALFIFIGSAPHTATVADLVELDEKGYVLTGPDLPSAASGRPAGWLPDRDPYLFETSVPGIFAAGDVRAGSGKRVAAAVGEGSGCVSVVHRYLATV